MRKISTQLLLLVLLGTAKLNAQITVSGSLGGTKDGTYATFTGAGTTPNAGGGVFDALNSAAQTGATISILITADVTTEPGTKALTGGAWTSISITPSGVRTISGNVPGGSLLQFGGADNVTINGLNSGSNSLVISNLSSSSSGNTSTILFFNDATNNTITNCSILGSSTTGLTTNGGNIFFSTGTATGNDNNTISNCDIGPAGANLPTKCIFGNGLTGGANGNSGITINNNNIFDYFGAGVASAGIYINTGCSVWSITNNRLYQTGTRTWSTGATHTGIDINGNLVTQGAQAFTVTGNTIGYATKTQTGIYTLTGGSTGKFIGIQFNGIVGGTVSNINSNTIAAVSMTGVTSSGTTSGSPFTAILVNSGAVNTNSNMIGSQNVTGSLTFTTNTTLACDIMGISNSGSTDPWTANNNNIGGILVTNAGSGTTSFFGIRATMNNTATITAATNNIGGTIVNSIQLTATGNSSQVIGIITNDPPATFTSNTIRNLTSNAGVLDGTNASVIGLCVNAPLSNHTLSLNVIHSLSNIAPAGSSAVTGIYFAPSTGANLVERNFIHSLSVSSMTDLPLVDGIRIDNGTTTYRNNMIRLGIDASGNALTNDIFMSGINENADAVDKFYFNSVYVGGAGVDGGLPSYALNSVVNNYSNSDYRNNIFWNARSNGIGTGHHYAIGFNFFGTSPTSDYNIIYATGTGGVFGVFDIEYSNLGTWITGTGLDNHSIEADPKFIAPNGNSSTVDLHIHPTNATPVEGNGILIPSVITDYDGQTRALLSPTDIGADAGDFGGNVWTGANNSTDYADGGNWNGLSVPGSTVVITIPTGVTFKPVLDMNRTIKSLQLGSGSFLDLNGKTLTVNGNISGSGTLTGSSTSNLTIAGAAGTLNFTQTSASTRALNNLTLNSAGSATLGNALDVYGTIALTSATLNLNAQNLTLKSNTTNTARIANLTGSTLSGATNVTMERFIKLRAGNVGRAYRLLAPTVNTTGTMRANWMEGGMVATVGGTSNPVANYGTHITGAGGNTNFFDVTGSNASSAFFITNGVTPGYPAIGSTQVGTGIATMNALTGYFLYVRGDRSMDLTLPLAPGTNPTSSTTLRTTGTLLTGTKTEADFAAMDATNLAFNLVTNPYASPIDWAQIRGDAGTTNLSTSYTLWDANLGSRGAFATVNTAGVASGGSAATVNIQSGQAFFVQATGAGTPTIAIKEAFKVAGNNNAVFLVPPQTFGVGLYYTESTGYRRQADGVIAMYDNKYSAAIDADDAAEINNWDENIAIARDGKHLAIEARPVIVKSDDLPLFMNNMKKQAYEFEFTPASFTNTSLKAELIDNYLGTRTLLSVTNPTVVSFTVTADAASAATDRFKVVFGAFGSPTGVDAITIKASQQNAGVQVDWTSKTETDMVRYEVEKQTYGTSYSKVNTTNALGNSTNPVNYNWFDANPVMGYNFYRVKGIDKAGNVRYSDMVKVLFGKGEPGIVVYPNPVEGDVFKVDLNNLAKGTYLVELYNVSGQKVYTGQIQHDGGILVTKVINLNSDVSKGVYQLQLSNDNGFKTTQKIIKN